MSTNPSPIPSFNRPPNYFFDSMNPDHDDDYTPPFFARPKNHYDLNSKIMLSAIISLSFVVVLVIFLHIYARCVLRRQAARRRGTVVSSLGLTVHSGQPPKGLDPTVIASLPIFVYKRSDGRDDDTLIECAVCLSNLEDQEMVRLLPNCKHTFHAECIDKWLSSQSTCPICRTEAEPRIQPEPREGLVAPAGRYGGVAATTPPLERVNSCIEGSSSLESGNVNASSSKISGSSSNSRLSSFRRMLSRERSSRRLNQSEIDQEDGFDEDLERQ